MRQEHTIQKAAQLSGLTPHVIRAWERRYGVLTPHRTPSNRRLFTEEDIERLLLLGKAVQAGHRIGQIAGLPVEDLRSLLPEAPVPNTMQEAQAEEAGAMLEECLNAIERLDAEALENCLVRAASRLGTAAMIDQVLIGLLEYIGTGWREGTMRIAQEHMATAVVHSHLMRTLSAFQPPQPAPYLIVTTPTGQHHELGALLVAVTAALQGWRVLYLGPNLPAEEIAGAVHRSGAQAVALSIAYPPDDRRLSEELRTLRRCLGSDTPILAGGRSTIAYRDILVAIDALMPGDLKGLREVLETIQARVTSPAREKTPAPHERA